MRVASGGAGRRCAGRRPVSVLRRPPACRCVGPATSASRLILPGLPEAGGGGPGRPENPGRKYPVSTRPGVCGTPKRGWRGRLGSPGRRGPPRAQMASTEALCEGQSSLSRMGKACAAFPPEPFGIDDARPRSPSRGPQGPNWPKGLRSMPEGGGSVLWRNPRPVSPASPVSSLVSLSRPLRPSRPQRPRDSPSRTFTCTPSTPCWTAPPASRNCSRKSYGRA